LFAGRQSQPFEIGKQAQITVGQAQRTRRFWSLK